MRIAKWFGLTLVLLSLAGVCLGLMTYSFAGFPFGGAAGVAEGHAAAMRTIWVSLLCLVIGMGLVIAWRRSKVKRGNQKENNGSGE